MRCVKIVLLVAALAGISSAGRAQETNTDLGTGLLEKLTVWWGEIQVGLSRCRLMRMSGSQDWAELARTTHAEAIAAGYSEDATLAR
jgi:hypothetical protein